MSEREAREPAHLYPGCLASYVYPEIGLAAGRLLEAAGMAPRLVRGQGCCGMPALGMLDLEGARRMASDTVRLLSGLAGPIVTVCPTCSVALRQEYPRLLAEDELAGPARAVAARTQELSELLAARGFAPQPVSGAEAMTVAYHESCHLKRSLGVTEAPRRLLAAAGYRLAEVPEADRCCGFAGTYAVRMEPVSMRILERKMACLASVQPGVIATDCPGCLLQLSRGRERFGVAAPVRHTAVLLAGKPGRKELRPGAW